MKTGSLSSIATLARNDNDLAAMALKEFLKQKEEVRDLRMALARVFEQLLIAVSPSTSKVSNYSLMLLWGCLLSHRVPADKFERTILPTC